MFIQIPESCMSEIPMQTSQNLLVNQQDYFGENEEYDSNLVRHYDSAASNLERKTNKSTD